MQEIYSLDFSRDGRFLVSGSGDKSARVWDIEKGTCVFDLRIEDFLHNEHGPIDAGITSVACKSIRVSSSHYLTCPNADADQ
jgi:glucose repression regulatory protein TUP1